MNTEESIEELTLDEIQRRLQADAQRLSIEIENAERAARMHASGLISLVEPPSPAALERDRAKLRDIRNKLAEVAREQAEAREQAKREAEAAAAKRQQDIADARRAALVARMAFDRAQAMRLQTSLGEDIAAYEQACEACDEARRAFDRAEQALGQLEE